MTARISPFSALPVTFLNTLLFWMSTHTSVKLSVGLTSPSFMAAVRTRTDNHFPFVVDLVWLVA